MTDHDNDFVTSMSAIGAMPKSAFTIQSISPSVLAVILTIPLMIMLCLAADNITTGEFLISLMVIYLAMLVYSYAFCFFPAPVIVATTLGLYFIISGYPTAAVREWQIYNAALRQHDECKQAMSTYPDPSSFQYQSELQYIDTCQATKPQQFCRFDTPFVENLSKDINSDADKLPRICSTFIAPTWKAGDTRLAVFGGENDL